MQSVIKTIFIFLLFAVNTYASSLIVTPAGDFNSSSHSYAITKETFTFSQKSDVNSSLSANGYNYSILAYSSLDQTTKDSLKSHYGSYFYALDNSGLIDINNEKTCTDSKSFPNQYWQCGNDLKPKSGKYNFLLNSAVLPAGTADTPNSSFPFQPTDMVCAVDLNNNGTLDQGEITKCTFTDPPTSSYLCPLDETTCTDTNSNPICPPGGSLNTTTDKCESTNTNPSCPTGYNYDSTLDKCLATPVCANGGSLNPSTDKCEIVISSSSCPSGYSYNSTLKACTKSVSCLNGGVYNPTTDKCEADVTYNCPSGYTYDSTNNLCVQALSCPAGSNYSATAKKCIKSVITSCPSGYTLNGSICQKTPACPSGMTYNGSRNRCEKAASGGGSGHGSCNASTSYSGNGTSKVELISFLGDPMGIYNGIQISGGSIRFMNIVYNIHNNIYSPHQSYGSWVPLNGNGTSEVNSENDNFHPTGVYDGIQISGGNIRFMLSQYSQGNGYSPYESYGSWVPLNGNGASTVEFTSYGYPLGVYDGIQISGGNIRFMLAQYDDGYSLHQSYGSWVPFVTTNYTCSLNGRSYSNYSTCYNSCSYINPYTCSVGTLSGTLCIANPTCSSGGSLNTATDKCQITPTLSCSSGYSYDSAISACVANPICPSGGSLNTSLNKCQIAITDTCPSGYTLNGSVCQSSPVCGYGFFDGTINKCKLSAAALCPAKYTFDSSSNTCREPPICPSGSSYSTTVNQCAASSNHNCPTGYAYNNNTRLCEAYPICQSGAYNPVTNLCYAGKNTCPYGNQYACYPVNGVNECSQTQCRQFGKISVTNTGTTQGATDKKNNGTVNAAGQCIGQIYIFNGKDMRCRTAGIGDAFTNLCVKKRSFLGLSRANPTERLLGEMRSWHKLDGKNGQCHYVGSYCSSKFLSLCLQHKETFCCFSSPLARIIQEQGRTQPQINIAWGNPKSPNCRGFTPTEFQKIDFTKINFSEYFSDITSKQVAPAASGLSNAVNNAVSKFKQSINHP